MKVVDVGVPSARLLRWESVMINYNRFAKMSTTNENFVESPEFSCQGNQWSLYVYPGGDAFASGGMVSVQVCNKSNQPMCVNYFLSVRDSMGKEIIFYFPSSVVEFTAFGKERCRSGESNFAQRSALLNVLDSGTLTFYVRMKISSKSISSITPFVPENPLRKNVMKKILAEDYADVVFEVSGTYKQAEQSSCKRVKTVPSEKFHAHRLILHEGAPILAQLCKTGKGMPSDSVTINDVTPSTFRHMLHYLYGGQLSQDDIKGDERMLIDAADKYGIVNLKMEAETCYVTNLTLTTENVLDALSYAHSKNCALLKEAALDYIWDNRDKVVADVKFEDVPGGYMVKDLLIATKWENHAIQYICRGEDDFTAMRVNVLRRLLYEKGLDVDGSREAMIGVLKESFDCMISRNCV